jgi:putative ABC transport system ATP-binding protein
MQITAAVELARYDCRTIRPMVVRPSASLTEGLLLTPSQVLTFRGSDLRKIYRTGETEVHALRGVDLAIPAGEVLVFLGPSGSGKSTLLNIVGGLDRPTSGTLHYRDTELTALSETELTRFRRANVGFIFQFYNLIPSLTAEENVRLVTDIADNPMPAADALALVGLADRRDHYPAQLSGGEQQRVAVARAIAKQPGVLLCDEPTGALDSATGVRVLETLARANRELGTTVLIITHNAGIAAMANRILHFLDGQIASEEMNAAPIDPGRIWW